MSGSIADAISRREMPVFAGFIVGLSVVAFSAFRREYTPAMAC